MPDLSKMEEALKRAEAAVADMRAIMSGTSETPELESLESLKSVLNSNNWPVSAKPNMIVNPNDDTAKTQRGRGVIELMLDEDVIGKKFLDFGCGEGHPAAYVASKQAAISVGYDVKPQSWDKLTAVNLKLTDNWDEVVANGPYQIILAFDVIDHLLDSTPVEALLKMKSVLADNGKIFLRAHPFTSRHATHNYHDLNKAWIHLVFTPDELKQILPNPQYMIENNGKAMFPLKTYGTYFEEAGLAVIEGKIRKQSDEIEPFFRTPAIANRIIANTKMGMFPEFQMCMQWIDYQLIKK